MGGTREALSVFSLRDKHRACGGGGRKFPASLITAKKGGRKKRRHGPSSRGKIGHYEVSRHGKSHQQLIILHYRG